MSTFVSSVSIWTPKMCPKARLYSIKVAKNPDERTSDEHHFLNVFHTKAPRGNKVEGSPNRMKTLLKILGTHSAIPLVWGHLKRGIAE